MSCKETYMKAWREKNKGKLQAYQRAWRITNNISVSIAQKKHSKKKRALRYKMIANAKDKQCADCGLRYPPCVMDFDHVRGKKLFTIADNIKGPLLKLIEEIEKCDIVCANCHRLRELQRRESCR